MYNFSSPETGGGTEAVYDELRQRMEYGGTTIEWWQGIFAELTEAKQYLTDQKLVAEVDDLMARYQDLTRWMRKDQKSMQEALRETNVVVQKVMEAIRKH